MKRIAVVILNWNGASMMRSFLPFVVAHSSDEAEVVVADNGSDDDSCAMLRNEFPEVRLIELGRNYGFADGYNKALEQVRAEYFVLLNSDVETVAGWLRPMLSYMDAHPEVAACQPKLLSYRDRGSFEYAGGAGGFIDRYGYPFCRGRIFADVENDRGQYDDIVPVMWATGAALMVRRRDWKEAGGLDGRFFAHMEEIDFCWRLRARGRGIVCIPGSVVYHVGGATLNRESPRKTFLNFRNNLLMLYKNLPQEELRHIMRVRGWLDCIAALKFLLTGDLSNARAVWRARREYRRLLPGFREARAVNMAAATGARIPERTSCSILFQYYLCGRKTFGSLKDKF